MRYQLDALIKFQKVPENREKWKVFIRKDLDDVKWYNIPRYMTYLPRFLFMWFTVIIATGSAAIGMAFTTKPEKFKNDPTYIDEENW